MSIDPHIHLDLATMRLRTDLGGARAGENGAQSHAGADPEAEQRFRAALAAGTPGETTPEPASAPAPFALCRAPAVPPPGTRLAARMELTQQLGGEVERLMVGEGSGGGQQLRVDLKDDVMPGVSVVFEERDGRLQVDFICSVEDSRCKLNAALPDLAPTLAQRLRRDVLLGVQTNDEDDPCRLECLGTI